MNWEDVESHICSMVENGTYMSASEAFLVDTLEVKQENFITQDEIDYALGRGSGYEHGAFRIYEYFMEGHDQKEAVAFLKNEYGIGGGSGGLPGNDDSHNEHDGLADRPAERTSLKGKLSEMKARVSGTPAGRDAADKAKKKEKIL